MGCSLNCAKLKGHFPIGKRSHKRVIGAGAAALHLVRQTLNLRGKCL